MNPSDLYHQHGIRWLGGTRDGYSGNEIIFHVKRERKPFYCKHCKSTHIIRARVEIKALKRMAYAFRDNVCFDIWQPALHDYKVA